MIKSFKEKIYIAIKDQGLRRYLFNTIWLFSDQVLRLVAGLFVGIWVARYLGPNQFGVLNYALAFLAIFGVIAKLGLDNLIVRNIVNHPDKSDVYLGTAFWLKIIGAVITVTITGAYLLLSDEAYSTKIYILLLTSSLIFQSFEVTDFFFQAKVLSKFTSICKTIQLIISSLAKVYLISVRADLLSFIMVQFLDQITLGMTQFLAFRYYSKNSHFISHFNIEVAKNLLRNAWPLIFGSLVVMIYMRIDQIMIMKIIGEKEMGLFSAGVRLSEAWYFVPVIITNSLFPAVLNAKKTDEAEYKKRMQRLFSLMFIISIGVAIPISIASPWLVDIFYGEAYHAAAKILTLHVWTGVFVSLGVASSNSFLAENLQKFGLWKAIAGAIINIVLNLLLIPKLGIIGAAFSTLVCQMCASVFFNALYKKSRPIFKMQMNAILFYGSIFQGNKRRDLIK
jgi:O-antigen/teichoic acid export membrane protein